MINHIQRYKKIISSLINKSFPILKNKNIKVDECKKLENSADAKKFPFFLRIRTNHRLRKYKENHLRGIFSHELSHLEAFEHFNFFHYYILRDFMLWSKKYIQKEEKETDTNAIKKGYARELYAQRKLRWNCKDKMAKKNQWKYLSPEEIKEIAIKLDKW